MWTTGISDYFIFLNAIIGKDGLKRKYNYHKPIREVTKAEFIIFHAMLIAASAHSAQGGKMCNTENRCNSRKKMWLSNSTTYFSRYTKIWRFKTIKKFIPGICEDE